MKIIAGLGNPGSKYALTRHNAGFLAIDYYLKDLQIASCQSKFNAQICEARFDSEKVLFVRPLTYMNNSGEALQEICNFYKVGPATGLAVVHDEIDLPFGTIRTTPSSSAAGHNGVKSIIEKLGTQDFFRIRIGVEARASRDEMPTDAYVLKNFSTDEMERLTAEILPQVKTEMDKFLQI